VSAILAVLHLDGRPPDPALAARMLEATAQRAVDGFAVRVSGPLVLCHQHLWSRPEEVGEEQPLVEPGSGLLVAFDGRLDERAALRSALGALAPSGPVTDAQLVLAAYRRWEAELVTRLCGDFALAVWDPARQRLLLARDALGTRCLAYHHGPRTFVAATDVAAVLQHPDVPPAVDEVKVALFLASDWHDQERTFFTAVRYLAPAHAMTVGAQGGRRAWRHWSLDAEHRAPAASLAASAQALGEVLARATSDRLMGRGPVAVSLSGGLDSSTVAALAARVSGDGATHGALRTYSFVFDDLTACDERLWIVPTVERCGLRATYLAGDACFPLREPEAWRVEPDFVAADAFALLPDLVLRAAAADGCRALLTGHYGDILFWGGKHWLAEAVHDARLTQAAQWAWQSRRHLGARSDLWEQGGRALVPGRLKAAWRRVRPRPLSELAPAVSPGLAGRTQLAARLARHRQELESRRPGAGQRRFDLAGGPRPQALGVTRRLYEAAGLDLADPFHDRRVVELVMALPAGYLALPGCSKRLLREATRGLLPESVRTRPGKTDFGPLFRRGLLEQRREVVARLLEKPLVTRLDYVKPDWLSTEMARGGAWTAGGYHLWLCVSLELWLRRRHGHAVPTIAPAGCAGPDSPS